MLAENIDVADWFGEYPEIEDVQWAVTWGSLFGEGVPIDDVTLELADEFVWQFDNALSCLFPAARVVVAHDGADDAPSHYTISPNGDVESPFLAWEAMDAAAAVELSLLGSAWWKSKRLAAKLRVVA